MSLKAYYGEFLVSPAPLHLELNYCSHRCAYCFANLNNPQRRTDLTQTINLLKDFKNRDSLPARLLQEGYPVLMSNLVDPFAASNDHQTIPLLELMRAQGIPVTIQTRGGRRIDDALEILEPSVWYISILHNNEEIQRRVEPGAPSPKSRFQLIEKLRSRGHRVVVGLNPLVEEWLPNPEPLIDDIKTAGAEGVWIQELHFNRDQLKTMPPRDRAALGEKLIAEGLARTYQKQASKNGHLDWARLYVQEVGLEVFSAGQPNASEFFKPWRETYAKTFPVMQDLVNWAHVERPDIISIDDFYAHIGLERLPKGVLPGMHHYIGSTARTIVKQMIVPPRQTYKQLLRLIYNLFDAMQSPAKTLAFAYAAEFEEDGYYELVDENRDRYLVFTPEGSYYSHVHYARGG